jgi:hypothetical protein
MKHLLLLILIICAYCDDKPTLKVLSSTFKGPNLSFFGVNYTLDKSHNNGADVDIFSSVKNVDEFIKNNDSSLYNLIGTFSNLI